jgi:hypothetical protein
MSTGITGGVGSLAARCRLQNPNAPTRRGDIENPDIDKGPEWVNGPITAYLGGVDSHKNAEVRAVLAPLRELALLLREQREALKRIG